jgi:hypothetical protein
MECPLWRWLISSRSVSKHGHHMQFLFQIGRFLRNLLLWNCLAIWTETWLWQETSSCMEGSVLSFLKAEWKVSDTGSAHWASSWSLNVTFPCLSILFVNKHGLTSVNIWYKSGCSRYNGQIFNNKKDWERFWPQWTSRES